MAEPFNDTLPVRKTYFINESERSVDPEDDAGKVAQLEADGRFSREFLQNAVTFPGKSFAPINGSVTPVAVSITDHGLIAPASVAAASVQLKRPIGFIDKDYSALTALMPTYLSGATSDLATFSLTANAGEKRMIAVSVQGSSVPSTVTWNGISLVLADSILNVFSSLDLSVWVLPIGDNVSNQTHNVVVTGAGTIGRINAVVYQSVNQTVTYSKVAKGNSSGGGLGVVTEMADGFGVFLASYINSDNGQVDSLPASYTTRISGTFSGGNFRMGEFTGNDLSVFAGGSNNFFNAAIVLALKSAVTPHTGLDVRYSGVVSGFTGLTPGALYYFQNTVGAIGTSPGATSIVAGRAVSATELLIVN